jgi:hypothetical protein
MEKRAADMTAPGGLAGVSLAFMRKQRTASTAVAHGRPPEPHQGNDCKTDGEKVTLR